MRNNHEFGTLYDVNLVRQAVPVYSIGSTTQIIPNHGKTLLTSTSTGTFTLQAPEAGVRAVLVKTANSTGIITVNSGSTSIFFNYSSNTNLTFDAQAELVELEGQSSTRWDILSNVGSVGTS